MFSCQVYGIFKTACFEEHLQTAARIRRSFDTINLKQSSFCTIYTFKILVSERKYENNLKNRESQKQFHIYNVYVMFYCEIQWLYQNLKGENLSF